MSEKVNGRQTLFCLSTYSTPPGTFVTLYAYFTDKKFPTTLVYLYKTIPGELSIARSQGLLYLTAVIICNKYNIK